MKIESIKRGVNLYTDYTIVRAENSTPLFIKDKDQSIFKRLNESEEIDSILAELKQAGKLKVGNPNTEKEPVRILKPKKNETKKSN